MMQPDNLYDTGRNRSNKIKTHFARIIVSVTKEKPYYLIMYFDPTDREYHLGFGSYCLEYVREWLSAEFEIVGDNEPVKHGRWRGWHGDKMIAEDKYRHYHYYSCNVCETRSAIASNFCPNCGAKMIKEEKNG